VPVFAHLGLQEATSDFLPEMSCQKHVSYFMWDQTVYESGKKKIACIPGNKNPHFFMAILTFCLWITLKK
jgi:hypothetical protein